MKKFNTLFSSNFSFGGVILAFAALVLVSSCSSEYHWVKAKSANPKFATKSDNYASANPVADEKSASLATASDNSSVAAEPAPAASNAIATATAPANAQATLAQAETKAAEIRSHLSTERKAALNSDNKAVRKEAVRQTLHEELAKDAQFNSLPESKKAMIEKVLSNKSASMAAPAKSVGGFNTLLLVGLILLLVGLILSFVPGIWIVGLIFVLVGTVLAILGLVQMLA